MTAAAPINPEAGTRTVAELRGIGKYYGKGEGRIHALQDINLELRAGEVTLIEGPSGSGKTTLLQVLGLLLPPDEGTLTVCGRQWAGCPESRLTEARRKHIAFVFQDFNLFSSLSAHDNVAIVAQLHGPNPDPAATRILAQLDMSSRAGHLPAEMSGGQKQRVSIGRALASGGELILADEPTANLDWAVGEPIVRLLSHAAHQQGRCVVMVSHDARLEPYADRIVRLTDGRVQSDHMNPHPIIAAPPAPAAAAPFPPRQRISILAWLLLAVLAGAIGLATFTFLRPAAGAPALGPGADPGGTGATPAPATAPAVGGGEVVAAAPAVVEPHSRMIQIASDRTGTVKRILVKPGDRVKAGDPLVQLDDEESRSTLLLRKADLAQATAALADLKAGTRPERKQEAAAQVTEAQARYQRAVFEAKRMHDLEASNSVGAADVRAAEESLGVTKGELERTQALLDMANNGPTATEIERAKAQVDQAEANLNVAQVTLDRRNMTSPIDGRVVYVHLEPGEAVTDLNIRPIISLAATGNQRLRAEVDEIDIDRIKVGQSVDAVTDSFPGRHYRGKVILMEWLMGRRNVRTSRPTEMQDTRVREVVIELDDAASDLPIDLLMTVRFLADGKPGN